MRRILLLCLLLCLIACPAAAQAAGTDVQTMVIEQVYECPEIVTVLEEKPRNRIQSLTVSRELSDGIQYTFDKIVTIGGEADPDSRVNIVVYTINDRRRPVIWYQKEVQIGPSGLLQEEMPLSTAGSQWVMVGISDTHGTACRFFEVHRKSEETLEELLHFRLNLYEEFGQ